MNKKIRVTILDDHQNIIDGYVFRLSANPQIEVVATISFGELLEPTLAGHPTDQHPCHQHVCGTRIDPRGNGSRGKRIYIERRPDHSKGSGKRGYVRCRGRHSLQSKGAPALHQTPVKRE